MSAMRCQGLRAGLSRWRRGRFGPALRPLPHISHPEMHGSEPRFELADTLPGGRRWWPRRALSHALVATEGPQPGP